MSNHSGSHQTFPVPYKLLLQLAVNYGSIMALAGILGFVLTNSFGKESQVSSIVSIAVYVAEAFAVYYGFKKFKSVYGSIKMRDGIMLALFIGTFSGLLIAVYMYLYYYVINPDAFDKMAELQRETLSKMDQFKDKPELIDEQIGMLRSGFPYLILFGSLVGQLFIAMLAGITSAFMLKDKELV